MMSCFLLHSCFGVLICVGVIFYSGVSSERIRPDNIAVVVGENWNLFYESSADYFFVNWYVVDANGKRLLFLNGTKVSRKDTLSQRSTVRIHPDGDTILHTLQVNNSELSDAGRYILEDIMAEPVVEVSAEVIILDHDTDCILWPNPAEAGLPIHVDCITPYYGRWGPVIDCYGPTLNDTEITGKNENNISQFNFTGSPSEGMPRANITCWAYFESPTIEEYPGLSMQSPTYTSIWMEEIEVYYPATFIGLSSNQTEYDIGDVITCSASGGNPDPTYMWSTFSGVTLSDTDTLTITRDMAAQEYNVSCIATTTIYSMEYELLMDASFFVNPLPTTTTTTTTTTTPLPSDTVIGTNGSRDKSRKMKKVDDRLMIIIIVGTIAVILALTLIVILVICCVQKDIWVFDKATKYKGQDRTM